MQHGGAFARLELGEGSTLFVPGVWQDERIGLIAMCGYYDMVEGFYLSVCEMEQDVAIGIVRYVLDWAIKEQMVRREAFHDSIDIAVGAVFESTPLRARI